MQQMLPTLRLLSNSPKKCESSFPMLMTSMVDFAGLQKHLCDPNDAERGKHRTRAERGGQFGERILAHQAQCCQGPHQLHQPQGKGPPKRRPSLTSVCPFSPF